jgi:hypothetical protein
MDTLEKIFGGANRVKLMRLFLFNSALYFETADIAERSKIDSSKTRSELNFLAKADLIKKSKRGNKTVWYLNDKFPYLVEFQRLLLETSLKNSKPILKKLAKIGKLKFIAFSGIFKDLQDSRIDILIVAEGSRKSTSDSVMASIEADIGKEIRFAVLNSEDFKYRLGVGDRLIRDVLDYPHEIVLDKLGVLL